MNTNQQLYLNTKRHPKKVHFIACTIIFFSIVSTLTLPICGHAESWEDWTGTDKDGSTITSDILIDYFEAHDRWLEDKNSGTRFDLSGADLSGIDLSETNLSGARLRGANLSNAHLSKANLSGVDLSGANLTNSTLYWTDLTRADLYKSNLAGARAAGVILSKTNLRDANLSEADLEGATIISANLYSTRMTGTNLEGADLTKSIFYKTNIDNARFSNANFSEITYDLPIGSPSKNFVGGIRGIDSMIFSSNDGHSGISTLRKLFQENGLRDSERMATYAIERGKTKFQSNFLEKIFRMVLFEWTCGYGLHYGRPLTILAILIIIFSAIYTIPIIKRCENGCLYKIWNKDDLPSGIGSKEPEIVNALGINAISLALYFSILTACRIGWREFNFGNWRPMRSKFQ